MPREQAVLYLRSSKDRSDVSIDAQRRELYVLAKAREIIIVGEYADAVESGKDEDRPGFQNLLCDLRSPSRTWNLILVLDTARISRRRLHAVIFEEQECRRHNVRILYKSLPDADPITEMLLKSILQAMDEWHSLTSKTKGLAGMAENIRQGYRAGGTPPTGYRIKRIETGAIREGAPVTKSKLIPDENALQIRAYLQNRARGVSRNDSAKLAGIYGKTGTTLLGIEKNAMTYAGHTIWNRHQEKGSKDYSSVLRDESEWVIHKNTHEPLISEEEAQQILEMLATTSKRRKRNGNNYTYMLSGILFAPKGEAWWGDCGYYRLGKTVRVAAHNVDKAILENVREYATSPAVAEAVAKHYQKMRAEQQYQKKNFDKIDNEIKEFDKKISKLVDYLAETSSPAPILRNIEGMEKDRDALVSTKTALLNQLEGISAYKNVTPAVIQKTLSNLIENMQQEAPEQLRAGLHRLIQKVELCPETFQATITYQINLTESGGKVVLPRGVEPLLPT